MSRFNVVCNTYHFTGKFRRGGERRISRGIGHVERNLLESNANSGNVVPRERVNARLLQSANNLRTETALCII